MAEAAAIGILPHIFIDMTMRELHAAFSGYALARRREKKLLFEVAWNQANFTRAKKLPPLRPILIRIDPPKPLSPKAMRAALVSAFSALGGQVIRRKKGTDPPES